MEKHHLPYLDIMIQYACNLVCAGCVSMSDQPRKGTVSIEEGASWLQQWSERLSLDVVCLFGGEPFMNPDLDRWVRETRKAWPDAHLKIITNGHYLKQRKEIIPTLLEIGNATLQVSCHHRFGPQYVEMKTNLIKLLDDNGTWKNITVDNDVVHLGMQQGDVIVQLAVFGNFIKPYNGVAQLMRPWDNKNPAAAHALCGSPRNPILYKNRLYKCAPIANLRDTLELHILESNYTWIPYLKYTGYGLEDDLQPYIDDFGKPTPSICTMCCDIKEFAEIDHYGPGGVGDKRQLYLWQE